MPHTNWPVMYRDRSLRVAVTGMMTALALVGLYSLTAIPNVELGSVVLFSTAYLFGLGVGVMCALLVSIIYAVFNPWGTSVPLIWFTQLIGWSFMVLIGELLRRRKNRRSMRQQQFTFAIAGITTTLYYDIITNVGFALTANVAVLVVLIAGIPFMIVHVISNGVFFPMSVPLIERAVAELLTSFVDVEECSSETDHPEPEKKRQTLDYSHATTLIAEDS